MTQTIQRKPAATGQAVSIVLGKARKLTRASFLGNRSELIDERVYTVGA